MTEDMTIIAEEAYLAAKEILEKARTGAGRAVCGRLFYQ